MTKLPSTLESSLPSDAFALLESIAGKASEMHMPIYLVGGSVRDVLLGTPLNDLDLVVEGDAAALALAVSLEAGSGKPARSQFGTATVRLRGQRFDLATARRETYPRPGALPKVSPSTIQDDLARRDFTINAMAMALSGPHHQCLLDPHGGRKDLDTGVIRVLHEGSFVDDPTRLLRAVRYEQRLGLLLEGQTLGLLLEAVPGGTLDTVSGERLRRELQHMFEEKRPHLPLGRSGNMGILRAIYHPLGEGTATVALADHAAGQIPLAYLAALSYPLSPQEGDGFIQRLRMPSRWAKVVGDTISLKLRCGGDPGARPQMGGADLPTPEMCHFLDSLSPISIQVAALLSTLSTAREALAIYLTRLRHVKPSLDGRDLIAMGLAQGPALGEVLRKLRAARIEGRVSTRSEEMRLAKEYIGTKGG